MSGGSRAARARSEGLVVSDLDGEVLVYDLERHKAHCLSAPMAAAWRECDGRSGVAQITERLRSRGLDVDEDVVGLSLRRLARARLLTTSRPAPAGPVAARREWIRKAALAGLAILSIEAPTAAQAATCISQSACERLSQQGRGCPGSPCCDAPGKSCKKQGNGTQCNCS